MLAVHVDQPLRPCALVQVVDILGDDQQRAGPRCIEPGERFVRGVRRLRLERRTPCVVEAVDEVGVAREGIGRRDRSEEHTSEILVIMSSPYAVYFWIKK